MPDEPDEDSNWEIQWTRYQYPCHDIGERWMKISGGLSDGIWLSQIIIHYDDGEDDPLFHTFTAFCAAISFNGLTQTTVPCIYPQYSGLINWHGFCIGKDCTGTPRDTLYLNLYDNGQNQAYVTDIAPDIQFQCTSDPTTIPTEFPTMSPSISTTATPKAPSTSPLDIPTTLNPTPMPTQLGDQTSTTSSATSTGIDTYTR